MKSKPKILFVFDHKKPEWWMDGLWAALNLLEEDFKIDKENLQNYRGITSMYDFVLGWGAFGSRVDKYCQEKRQSTTKYGLCIAGNAFPPTGALNYDVLFYETSWYRPQIDFHANIVKAFGVNTDIFCKPSFPVPIIWDYIGVGAFAKWKRWEKFADKKGMRLVVGEYQMDNQSESNGIVVDLVKNGVMVSPTVSPLDVANYYTWSRTMYMPSDVYGGGERAILEARSCGCEVLIEEDNPKLKELIDCPIPTHEDYAKKLKEAICKLL